MVHVNFTGTFQMNIAGKNKNTNVYNISYIIKTKSKKQVIFKMLFQKYALALPCKQISNCVTKN